MATFGLTGSELLDDAATSDPQRPVWRGKLSTLQDDRELQWLQEDSNIQEAANHLVANQSPQSGSPAPRGPQSHQGALPLLLMCEMMIGNKQEVKLNNILLTCAELSWTAPELSQRDVLKVKLTHLNNQTLLILLLSIVWIGIESDEVGPKLYWGMCVISKVCLYVCLSVRVCGQGNIDAIG